MAQLFPTTRDPSHVQLATFRDRLNSGLLLGDRRRLHFLKSRQRLLLVLRCLNDDLGVKIPSCHGFEFPLVQLFDDVVGFGRAR